MVKKSHAECNKMEDWYRARLSDLYFRLENSHDPELVNMVTEIEVKLFDIIKQCSHDHNHEVKAIV